MAKKTINVKSSTPRYGRKIREKLNLLKTMRNRKKTCPHCKAKRVKRVAAGIWTCRKCGSKFSGRAYDVGNVKSREAES